MTVDRRGLLAGGAAALASTALPSPVRAAAVKPLTTPILGDARAPKRMILWGSLTCPYTGLLVALLTRMQMEMPKTLAVEWRHFPTHPPDPALHVPAMADPASNFWPFATEVLRRVYAAKGSYAELTNDRIEQLAAETGGSAKAVRAAWQAPALWRRVKQDLMAGKLMGVAKTPGLFFNGYFLTPDGIPTDLNAFDRELRKMVAA